MASGGEARKGDRVLISRIPDPARRAEAEKAWQLEYYTEVAAAQRARLERRILSRQDFACNRPPFLPGWRATPGPEAA